MDFKAGDNVVFKHPEHSWTIGQVTAASGGIYSCKTADETRKEVKPGEVVEKLKREEVDVLHADCMNIDPKKSHDLLNLTVLHEATLLRCLYVRYMDDVIYTNIGSIVVALNPFNFRIPRYMPEQMKNYLAVRKHMSKEPSLHLVPHSWMQAHNTYYEMMEDQRNQCILISGESGAGKTEATKIVMNYLGAVSSMDGNEEEKKASSAVGVKLTSCSPILEAFGNAKTVRNDNSSRFGKFMEVKFSAQGRLMGAKTTKYLLEKSRIVTAADQERVYHSFYIVLRGKYNRLLGLEGEANYGSVNSGKCLYIKSPPENGDFDTPEDFDEVCDSMKYLGMHEDEIKSVWTIPAAVLSLLNVRFHGTAESSALDESTRKYFDHAAKLLRIDPAPLMDELLTTTRVLPGGQFAKNPNKLSQADDIRDSTCKHMYDGIFAFLVERCNELCDVPANGNWIGLLDIFGFENFKTNSFEQICINLTNETLQNHYNTFIFTKDMEECSSEGIDITNIKCPDNAPCMKMLTGPQGIMPLLDECSQLNKSPTEFFLMVEEKHGHNKFFAKKDKVSKEQFIVKHYAADVIYTVAGWIEKNRDTLKDAIKLIIRSSTDKLIARVLPAPIPKEEKKGGRDPTVGGFFAQQLAQLMEVINSTNPHWIRCIKPHPAKKAKMFNGSTTMSQLESSGVLGTIEIRRAGYPVRMQHEVFAKKYQVCVTASAQDNVKNACGSILSNAHLNVPEFSQMGLTKVFMKQEALNKLEKYKDKCCVEIARNWQRIGQAYLERKTMWLLYIERHKAALLKARKEKEEKERLEREAAEKARREAEEKARIQREAEERFLREEKRKLLEKQVKAAINISRNIRGWCARQKIFHEVLEKSRAEYEAKRENQLVEERLAAREVDTQRLLAERQWIAYLNSVDHLKNKSKVDEQRKKDKVRVKERIQEREYKRKEEEAWAELEAEEALQRQGLQIKCDMIAKHKLQLKEQAKKAEILISERKLSPKKVTTDFQKRVARSAASDARTQETLVDYAVQRAAAFSPFQESARTMLSQTPPKVTGHPNLSLFDRSKNRWEREEEFLDSRAAASLAPTHQSSRSHIDSMFSGPPRTVDAAVRGNAHRTPQTTSQAVSPPPQSVYREPPWMSSGGETPSQRQFARQVASAVNWDTVFNS